MQRTHSINSITHDRYGYQGSEMDDEVKGAGNSYTTEFRQLDPRLGRWLTIDPKTAGTPWESPYVSMGNNPIWFTDKKGASIDSLSRGTFDEHKKNTQTRLDELRLTRDKMIKKGKEERLPYLNQSITQLEDALKELEAMDASTDMIFKIEMVSDTDPSLVAINANGLTERNGNVISIKSTTTHNLAHELKHGYQHMIGNLDEYNITNDYMDEQEAFQRAFAYSSIAYPDAGGYSYFNQALILKHYPPGTNYAVSTQILKISDKASVVIQYTAAASNKTLLTPVLAKEIKAKEQELIGSGMDPSAAANAAADMIFAEFMKRIGF